MRVRCGILLIVAIISSLGLVSCDRTETIIQYHDSNKQRIKSKAEYKDGKLNGLMAAYDINGKLLEVGEWRQDERDGLTISFYPNGDTSAIYNFRNGRALGEYKLFHESGSLKKMGFALDDKFVINQKNYDESGSMLPLEPVFRINSDTLKLGDTLVLRGSLSNVQDGRFLIGTMVLGKGFNKETGLIFDTLAYTKSNFNDYKLTFVPKDRGNFNYAIQFSYSFRTSLNIDTLVSFSNHGIIFVK